MREDSVLAIQELANQGELELAGAAADQLLDEEPHDPIALAIAGWIYAKAERFGLAYALTQKANMLRPGRTQVLNNLGMCAMGCSRWDEAEKHLLQALKADSRNTYAMSNLALVYVNQCRPDKTLEIAERSRAISKAEDPPLDEAVGYAHLMLGNWRKGWEGYEAALYGKIRQPRSYTGERYWHGEPVETLVVRGEQGIGDEVSFASVLPDVCEGREVILECDSRLEGLFKRSFPDIEVHGTRFERDTPEWATGRKIDAHVLIGSLCGHFRNNTTDFPGTPYLKADPERKAMWRKRFDAMPGRKIGIAWTGGKHNTGRERRCVDLELLEPLANGNTLISLEYKTPSEEDRALMSRMGIFHSSQVLQAKDYDETAALVDELDLVISAQTAVVHLAGALGKPCWVLVPEMPLWRYGMTGESFPWSKSVRLFRQKAGKWPIDQIVMELRR